MNVRSSVVKPKCWSCWSMAVARAVSGVESSTVAKSIAPDFALKNQATPRIRSWTWSARETRRSASIIGGSFSGGTLPINLSVTWKFCCGTQRTMGSTGEKLFRMAARFSRTDSGISNATNKRIGYASSEVSLKSGFALWRTTYVLQRYIKDTCAPWPARLAKPASEWHHGLPEELMHARQHPRCEPARCAPCLQVFLRYRRRVRQFQ